MFNYSSQTVGIIDTGSTPTSPIVADDMNPTPDATNYATSTLALDSLNLNYSAGIGVGSTTAFQTNTKVAFDTNQ